MAPQRIIFCEGNADKSDKGFDAKFYNKIFADDVPDTLFISRGGSGEVVKSEHLKAIIGQIAEATDVFVVIDRDDMTDAEREQKITEKTHVLGRRELEDYLYDPKVLSIFLRGKGCNKSIVRKILRERRKMLANQSGPENIKVISRDLFDKIRQISKLQNLGNRREEFAFQYLVPALMQTREVYDELKKDVFGTKGIWKTHF